MAEAAETRETVLSLLADLCQDGLVRTDLDADLFGLGLIDSIGFIDLLAGLHSRLGIAVAPTEVDRAELATPGKVLAFVERRLAP